MLLRSTTRALAALALGAVLTHSAAAQTAPGCADWDTTAYDTSGTLFVEGFLVAQEGAAGVEAFSASARKWNLVSPPGSSVVNSGDWCLTIKENAGIRAYSSRLNNSALLPPTVQPVDVRSHDDVAVVIGYDPASASFTAWGYSAVRGVWVAQPLGAQVGPTDVEISRFVVGVRDNDRYHGFSARTGMWQTYTATPGALLRADGNTLLADFASAGVGPNVAAFSGVRGCWSPSPPVGNPSPVLLDHNCAYIRVQGGTIGSFRGCGYSAYRAAWITSPFAQPFAGVSESITDNVILIDNSFTGVGIDAFGAGGGAWQPLPGPFRPLYWDEDYAIALDPSGDLLGFSGVCTGPWAPEPLAAGPVPPLPLTPPDHIGGVDAGFSLHVFLPAYNSWAPALPKSPSDVVLVADAVIECVTSGGVRAIATRWGNWVSNPPVSLTTAGTGSVIAHQSGVGTIDSFDERCDLWNPPAPFGTPTVMTAGRNLVVFSPPAGSVAGGVRAYSVQRGDYTSPGGIPLPLAVAPIAEENVAAMVDGGGALWAFGSPNDSHVYYAWPNGTEYHVSGGVFSSSVTCKPTLFDIGIRSNPGDFSYLLLGPTIQCPPIPLGGFGGSLWLPLVGTSIYSFVGVHDLDCMIDQKIPLGPPALACIQPWFQAITIDAVTLTPRFSCRRSDPAWIF